MSRIRSKDTSPELKVRRYLFAHGFRFRLHAKDLFGKPDIVLPKYRTVIFVHGCFWHGHAGCKYFVVPKTRTEWWMKKISRNRELDAQSTKWLKANKWNVITVFECDLKKDTAESTLRALVRTLKRKRTIGK